MLRLVLRNTLQVERMAGRRFYAAVPQQKQRNVAPPTTKSTPPAKNVAPHPSSPTTQSSSPTKTVLPHPGSFAAKSRSPAKPIPTNDADLTASVAENANKDAALAENPSRGASDDEFSRVFKKIIQHNSEDPHVLADNQIVLVIGVDGKKLGEMKFSEAESAAKEASAVLQVVTQSSDRTVVRLYSQEEHSQKVAEAHEKEVAKVQAAREAKELWMDTSREVHLKVGIMENDFATKINKAEEFLKKGSRIKIFVGFQMRKGLDLALIAKQQQEMMNRVVRRLEGCCIPPRENELRNMGRKGVAAVLKPVLELEQKAKESESKKQSTKKQRA